eukprot:756474-Hanusia_phi.AAC.4
MASRLRRGGETRGGGRGAGRVTASACTLAAVVEVEDPHAHEHEESRPHVAVQHEGAALEGDEAIARVAM